MAVSPLPWLFGELKSGYITSPAFLFQYSSCVGKRCQESVPFCVQKLHVKDVNDHSADEAWLGLV